MATEIMEKKPLVSLKEPFLRGSGKEMQRDRLALFLKVAQSCGDAGSFHIGPFRVVFFNSPELVHNVLVEHDADFEKGVFQRNGFKPIIGNGLLNLEGQTHQKQRKMLAPAFAHRRITNYADTMATITERTQQRWIDGATLDINREMTYLTMSIVAKALFDVEVADEADEIGEAITVSIQHVEYALTHIFPLPLSVPTSHNKLVKKNVDYLKQRIQAMIQERRANPTDRGDFLSMLVQLQYEDGEYLSDEQVRDEAITIFIAGHETTANALSWAFYLLSKQPEIYARLQQEAKTVLQGGTPTYADLANLPYALQVFKEAMRLYPPASAISRVPLHAVEIGGYALKRRDTVLMSPYTMHRRPDFYPNPEKFDPERFTPENEKKLPRYAYMPFGAGPHICIGNHFALMEGQVVLATLAQRVAFELIPGQDIQPKTTLTLKPTPTVKARLRRKD